MLRNLFYKTSVPLLFLIFGICQVAFSLDVPKPGRYDDRIRYIHYNDEDVVKINGFPGFVTTVSFEKGESTSKVIIGFADAWEVTPSGNKLIIKPKMLENADTNLLVITNKRLYNFELAVKQPKDSQALNRQKGMVFLLRFRYEAESNYDQPTFNTNQPIDIKKKSYRRKTIDDSSTTVLEQPITTIKTLENNIPPQAWKWERKTMIRSMKLKAPTDISTDGSNTGFLASANALNTTPELINPLVNSELNLLQQKNTEKINIEKRKKVEEDLQNALQSERRNYQYSLEGNDEIAPYEAWDDGTFTYMRFYAQQDFPAAFYIDEENQEALINMHFEDDVMVVHRVANKFILRRGNISTCVNNERRIFYTPYSQNGTTNKDVERILKEKEKEIKKDTDTEDKGKQYSPEQ